MGKESYIPALRFEFLTRFYDPLVRYTTREESFKTALLNQANLSNNQSILDIACGTGTLSIEIKRRAPRAKVFGIDIDAEILGMAQNKSRESAAGIYLSQSFSNSLPFAADSFDRVFSTLFFHHLTLPHKIETLQEILRVLKPNGEFHLADYALPRNKVQFILSKSIRVIDGHPSTHDNLRGRLKQLMEDAGFSDVERTGYFKTILGTIRLFKAIKK